MTDPLTDSNDKEFTLSPPQQAPAVPEKGFDKGESNFFAPPEDGSNIELKVDPNSQRLQLLKPWPKWDGEDVVNAPILLKAKGKCTTDAISPAGPWLRLRGHLDKFSDNMFMGAINAYDDEAGKGLNVLTNETGVPFSDIARDYKAKQVKWVVIGDWNYGEGSSREHAALSPRLLGSAAVIVRSFARIHESNLKKQGLLAFTFKNPDDYDKIREDDRVDLRNLADLAPNKPVECIVSHADGTKETFQLEHSYNSAQVEWFKAGSALNLLS
jgi:aconitate hydratase